MDIPGFDETIPAGQGKMYLQNPDKQTRKKKFTHRFLIKSKKDFPLYLMVLPGLLIVFIFKYIPMYGVIIAFKNYNPGVGIFNSEWAGLKYFIRFFNDPYCYRVLRNTIVLGFYSLAIGFPAPIILALLLNEIRLRTFKRVVQTISYMPHFLSIVIVVGLMMDLTSLSTGGINDVIQYFGGGRIHFFSRPEWFRTMYIVSGIWQGIGFSSIIYLAALAGINVELYEAATIDGATRWQKMLYVTLPGMTPTIIILFILAVGGIVSNDFLKIFLMYNPAIYETADVISTYVYRAGIEGANFSYGAAIGLFLSIIAFLFLYITNRISKKLGEVSLW